MSGEKVGKVDAVVVITIAVICTVGISWLQGMLPALDPVMNLLFGG